MVELSGHKPRRGVRLGLGLAGSFILLVTIGLLTLRQASVARARLEEGREAAERATAELLSGEAGAAEGAFVQAESTFLEAREELDHPLIRLARLVPVVGRTPDTVEAVTEAAFLAAKGGRVLAGALGELPGGVAALAPQDGRIPLEPLRKIASPLGQAGRLVTKARALLAGAPDSLLLGPVAETRREAMGRLGDLDRAIARAESLTQVLPAFLGGQGARRYFFGAQNPAELRGTGGFIGAFAVLTANRGHLRLGEFATIEELENVDVSNAPPPNPSYGRLYNRFGGAGFWPNINMTPDFPSAAVAIERLYRHTTGVRLDGTILADPASLAALLRVTGPAPVPGTETVVDAGSVVPFLTNQAYGAFEDPISRKPILGAVAGEVLQRYLQGGAADPAASIRVLAEAAMQGHLLFHATRQDEQAALETVGIEGALAEPIGDYLAVVGNNAAGNKLDFYADRSVRYQVHLGADGEGLGLVHVRLANRAPARTQPATIFGPHPTLPLNPGENLTYFSAYCTGTCRLESFRRDGVASEVGSERELGHRVYSTIVRLPSGRTECLDYDWTIPRAWSGDLAGGVYHLMFQTQSTVRPTRLIVEVQTPRGMRVSGASPGMRVQDDRAVWQGLAGHSMAFRVQFELALFGRGWDAPLELLGRSASRANTEPLATDTVSDRCPQPIGPTAPVVALGEYPPAAPIAGVSDTTLLRDQLVAVSGSGWEPGSIATVQLQEQQLAAPRVDPYGNFHTEIAVPGNTELGETSLKVSGRRASGPAATVHVDIEVLSDPIPSRTVPLLPDPSVLVLVAMVAALLIIDNVIQHRQTVRDRGRPTV